MGIIVGSKTFMECNGPGCLKKSDPRFEQREALDVAYTAGWYKDQNTGATYCPVCKTANRKE